VWNRSLEKAKELEKLGAKVCETKQSLAKEVDILITMVTAGEDVEDVLFGFGGVADELKL
jgi:3-hydroxyisobutyrate dehydrogenase-like beta-hydroxyacid dehydrogenase